MTNYHLPVGLLLLLLANLTHHSIYGEAIEDLHQNDSRTIEHDGSRLAKRFCGKEQSLFRKKSGICAYYPVTLNMPMSRERSDPRPNYRSRPKISRDAPKSKFPPHDAMQMTTSIHQDPHNTSRYIRRICRNIKIMKTGMYVISLRCDPSVKKMSIYVQSRAHINLIELPIECYSRENKITTSSMAHKLRKSDTLVTIFQASPTGETAEINAVLVDESMDSTPPYHRVSNRFAHGKRSLCDLVNPKTECPSLLNYLSLPEQSLTSKSKRYFSMDPLCVGLHLDKVGVYWVMLNVNGWEPGVGNYTLRLYVGRNRQIDLLTVETYRQYTSHSMAFFNSHKSNILSVEDAYQRSCRKNSNNHEHYFYQLTMVVLTKNTQYLFTTFANSKTYVLEFKDDLRFNYHIPTYPTSLVPRPLDVEGANWWYDVFNADLAGRYVISLRVLSEDNVTFNLAHSNSGCDEYVSSDMYFYFQRLASAQSFVLYMKQNARFKIQLTNIDDDLYGTEILKGSTFAIAWVNELYDK